MTQAYTIPFFPGINIYRALIATGAVRFGNDGRIIAVGGVPVVGNVDTILRLNGRRIPESLLFLPLQRGDAVGLELVVVGPFIPRSEIDSDTDRLIRDNLECNYEQLGLEEGQRF